MTKFTTGRERRGQSAGFQTSAVLQRGLSGATWEAAFSPRCDCLFVEQWPLVAGDAERNARNREACQQQPAAAAAPLTN